MLVEGLLLWSKVVAVNLNEDRHMKYYYLIGWGTKISKTNELNENTSHSGVWFSPFFLLSSVWPCRSTGADSHHHACISLRQILSRRLLLAQCPGRGHLGLCRTRYFHYYGQKIKNTCVGDRTVQAGKFCSILFLMSSQPIILWPFITSNSSKIKFSFSSLCVCLCVRIGQTWQ